MELPLGTGRITFDHSAFDVTVAEPPGGTAVDVREAASQALDSPHGPPLRDRVDPTDEVAIVTTDLTRATPDEVLLDELVDRLREIGIAEDQLTIVVGLGLHRPLTPEEIEEAYGDHAPQVSNHDPEDVVTVGTVDGVPIAINSTVAAAETVLSTGMVEPHQYAGFSGGAKTTVIGAGGESLIRYTHGPGVLGRDGVRLGRIDDNPFRAILDRAGDLVGVDFCLNVTQGPAGILGASAGDHRAVVEDLAKTARGAISVPVERTYDAVVAGVGAPKDANLYQASRGVTYVALGAADPLSSDGRIVVPAALPEGAGEGTGEQRFYEQLSTASDATSLYEELAAGYEPGVQRAFVLARVLRDHDVYVTNSEHPDVVEDCLMHARQDVVEALDSEMTVLVVPNAIDTLLTPSAEGGSH
jgi:nickel-dependent lactate racemase